MTEDGLGLLLGFRRDHAQRQRRQGVQRRSDARIETRMACAAGCIVGSIRLQEGQQLWRREVIAQLLCHVLEWFANVLSNGCLIWQYARHKAAQGVLEGQRNVAP